MSRPRGRPSKLTPETTRVLAECLEKGLTYTVACAAAGITYTSFRSWLIKGEAAGQGEYFDFFNTIRSAEMIGRRLLEERALKEAAALAILERRYPEDWGKRERHDPGGDIVVEVRWATAADAEKK